MKNDLEKQKHFLVAPPGIVSIERRLMNEALARLEGIEVKETRRGLAMPERNGGRLLFALDLTASRENTLRQARIATASMFDVVKAVGSIAVKLIYYRDMRECRATGWNDDPTVLSDCMKGLSCKAGKTQIARVLRFALNEKESLSGVVFIGDCCEERNDELAALAARLGEKKIPLYIFHERPDYLDFRAGQYPFGFCGQYINPAYFGPEMPGDDARIFKQLAELSGGQYCAFTADAGAVLRELLSTIAAFSAAGSAGVEQLRQNTTPEAKALQTRLLLGAAREVK